MYGKKIRTETIEQIEDTIRRLDEEIRKDEEELNMVAVMRI